MVLELRNVSKTYGRGETALTVLRDVTLSIPEGETCSIIGPSGSGKTTLLGIAAGLDEASQGSVTLNGERLESLDQDARAALRNRYVGFVFQSFQLIPTLTALENVLVPLELRGETKREKDAADLLDRVGLSKRLHHYPTQLSGGEQQRVALARAYINRPKILFADEPTGNLDAETSAPIVEMLLSLNRDFGSTLVLVTHDPALSARTRRVFAMRAGSIFSETVNES